MRRKMLVIALLGNTLTAGAAVADDNCTAPMSTWQPRAAVEEKARSLGWEVRRIRTDDGCYKVYARDAKGRHIEAEFDPASLALIEIEGADGDKYEAEDRKSEDDDDDDEGEGARGATPGAAPAPLLPRNPLIGKPKGEVN
ncbi:MAG: PepSY domain-containing protein [Paracoccaceae bacterium]|nr:PepSY domain-containing protein [Paracoccaceae bacterium]